MRLYVLKIVHEVFVLADSKQAAEDLASDIQHEEDYPFVHAIEWDGKANPQGWDDASCVYHYGSQDIKLIDAKEIHKSWTPTK